MMKSETAENDRNGGMRYASTIKPLQTKASSAFFKYLDKHLQANGKAGVPLFQPAPATQSAYPRENVAAFLEGLNIAVGSPKWRRAWIAVDAEENIVGHVDLRARPEPCSSHRALLGMGVRVDLRKNGIGSALLDFASEWARASGIIEIIDLEVISKNYPAVCLYEKAGFKHICEVEDMFRIDGQSVSHILITKKL